MRHVGGRAFFENEQGWVDSLAQGRGGSPVTVKFDTDDYYALLKRDARVGQWMSLGRSVQFVLDETVYVVAE